MAITYTWNVSTIDVYPTDEGQQTIIDDLKARIDASEE